VPLEAVGVTFEFGPFRLDEPARVLRLRDREVPLQPRVFSLLVYLIRSRDRVVSKDELLDKLWPGVTVTDNSLQRAVSALRSALREGGIEDAVRNIPRSGYRFCLDDDAGKAAEAPGATPADGRDRARRAAAEQDWSETVAQYALCDAEALGAEDLDRWALALQCVGKPSDAIPVLMRCCARHAQAGDNDAAAANAVSLSTIHMERGEGAVAKGWLARARDLVVESADSPAAGLVQYMAARLAASEGDIEGALKLAGSAYETGRRTGAAKVEALGLMYRGFFRLSLGDTRDGLADQDHAAALAFSQQTDPVTGGVLYCNILWACRTFGDWSRANQWTLGYQQACTTSGMAITGSCQLHRAEVLGVQGALPDALAHIQDSLARLADDAPWALGDAWRVMGDIQAAMGNGDDALAAYDKSYELGWNPEPGRALLLLERGEFDAAYASLERSLIGQSWWTMQRQGVLRAYLALVAAHAGRHDHAQALIDELAGSEQRWPMPSIRALTNEASAVLAHERGKPDEALRYLHLARQLWASCGCRLNATRLRLLIATLQMAAGDAAGAATELRTARTIAAELKSGKLVRQCDELLRQLAPPQGQSAQGS
jgi:DNA-binding winged helix-turn-helix (wHTH) protein